MLAACGPPQRGDGDSDAGADTSSTDDAEIEQRCDAPPTFAEGLVPTRVLHVAPGATGGDGSVTAPFGTIQAAAAVATPGTFIQLEPGVHAGDQYVANLYGTALAPIWIGGAEGTMPEIANGTQALQLTKPAYVVIQNVVVYGASGNGINIDDGAEYGNDTAAHHVAVVHVDIHDIGNGGNEDCLKVSGVNDLFVYDSRFARCGGNAEGSGIDHVGCHRSIVARNVFDAMSGNAVQAKGGSTDVDIRQNRMHDGGARVVNLGGSTGLEYFRPPLSTTVANAEARRIRVFDNIVTGATGAPFAFVGCVDCLVAYNLVYGTPTWLIRILQETVSQSGYTFEPASNGRVIDNSFVWRAATLSTHVNVGANTAPETFTFSHNLWFAVDAPDQSTPTLPVAEDGSVIGQGTGYQEYGLDDPRTYECYGPEFGRGVPVVELTGYFDGTCRKTFSTIGPLLQTSCTL
jgi:hypothetical protein